MARYVWARYCSSGGPKQSYYSPLVLSPVGDLVVGLVCLSVVCVGTHISATTSTHLFILGMMMAMIGE